MRFGRSRKTSPNHLIGDGNPLNGCTAPVLRPSALLSCIGLLIKDPDQRSGCLGHPLVTIILATCTLLLYLCAVSHHLLAKGLCCSGKHKIFQACGILTRIRGSDSRGLMEAGWGAGPDPAASLGREQLHNSQEECETSTPHPAQTAWSPKATSRDLKPGTLGTAPCLGSPSEPHRVLWINQRISQQKWWLFPFSKGSTRNEMEEIPFSSPIPTF